MTRKIVVDSSADPFAWAGAEIGCASLKIITDQKEYVDDAKLDIKKMVKELAEYKGKSGTACPSTEDWLSAFGEAEEVYCVSITSNLSGSYNAARLAAERYTEEHPDRKAMVVDSLSAGPELRLITRKLQKYIGTEYSFEEIKEKIAAYQQKTGLLFMLESMRNLANNGRVSPLVAKMAGLLGIRVVGKASDEGTLEPLEKPRGREKALEALMTQLKKHNFNGKKIYIAHCFNPEAAADLKERVLAAFPKCKATVYALGGLCSFYAEKGGLLVGYEKT
ncbi:MAG: DegV family protein [Clostridia bacterium]|nr:DegV family protein [Clostridia bacterium]